MKRGLLEKKDLLQGFLQNASGRGGVPVAVQGGALAGRSAVGTMGAIRGSPAVGSAEEEAGRKVRGLRREQDV